jgi:hypothetical protein
MPTFMKGGAATEALATRAPVEAEAISRAGASCFRPEASLAPQAEADTTLGPSPAWT